MHLLILIQHLTVYKATSHLLSHLIKINPVHTVINKGDDFLKCIPFDLVILLLL